MPPRTPSAAAFSNLSGLPRFHSVSSQAYFRCLHTTRPGHSPYAIVENEQSTSLPLLPRNASERRKLDETALARLPTSQILRTYLISTVSSSPTLLAACSKTLLGVLRSKSWLTDVEKNPLLKRVLYETFYKQFCAGEDKATARESMQALQNIGYHGVMLEYALEVLEDAASEDEVRDVEIWRKGLLESVDISRPGDYVALKYVNLINALN